MELTVRKGPDVFVPPGSYRRLEAGLCRYTDTLSEVPTVVLSCFDLRTRMLPFVLYDRWIFPAGTRTVAGALVQAGFRRTRAVFQLWNPHFRPSQARIDGRPVQILMVSSMALQGDAAFEAIREAWSMGEDRPLIIAGGPQAHYDAYRYWPIESRHGPVGPDVVCTGEVFVLLDLLTAVLAYHRPGEPFRRAFDRARLSGALEGVPGLVYLAPGATVREPALVDTGLQRLVQHFDELPDDVTGLSVLEPPHAGTGLSAAPLPENKVRRHAAICSVQMTQGCKFSCSYCPIPVINQKTWRFRSPEGLARQLRTVRERYGIKYFFGTDDNFFNKRQTALEFFEAIARTKMERGKKLGRQVRWGTEATQHDTWKNRDLLPLAREAGMNAVWFGIEDLTAELVNKGQKPEVTQSLFPLMHRHKIMPMAMMMFHDGQPFQTPRSLYGIANQIDFLRQAGAVSVQVTIHVPALGTREWERTFETGKVIHKLGGYEVTEAAHYEGNHVVVAGQTPGWLKQLQLLGAYFRFYNPFNLWRAARDDGSPLRWYRVGWQVLGLWGTLRTAWQLAPYVVRLLFSKPTFHRATPPLTTVPVRQAHGSFSRLPLTPIPADEARRAA